MTFQYINFIRNSIFSLSLGCHPSAAFSIYTDHRLPSVQPEKATRSLDLDFGKKISFLSNLIEVNGNHSASASILTKIFPEDFSDQGELKKELENFNYIAGSNQENVLQFTH